MKTISPIVKFLISKIYIIALLGMLFVGGVLSLTGFSAFQNKKNEPLIVVKDANRPSLSFDGSRIAVIPEIGLSEVYDVNTGKKLLSQRIKNSESVAISADGKRIKIFGDECTEINVENGQTITSGDTAFLKDGKDVGHGNIGNEGGMTTRTISSDLELVASEYPIWGKKNLPEQPAVLVGKLSDHSVVAELRTLDGFAPGDIWERTAMTPDGRIVAARRDNNVDKRRDKTVVWNVGSGKVLLELPLSSHWLSLSDDGKRLVTKESGDDGKIEIWDILTGRRISTLTETVNRRPVTISSGVISPDGKFLVTTGLEHILFWDTDTGTFVASQNQVSYSDGDLSSVTFSGDGKRIAVGTGSEVVTVWSIAEIIGKSK